MTRRRHLTLVVPLAAVGGAALYLLRDARQSDVPARPEPATVLKSVEVPSVATRLEITEGAEVREAKTISGTDPFELIRGLAKAAYDGEGRAQYRISRELDRCEMTLALVRKQPGDPETVIWSLPETGWPQPMKEGAIAELRRCIRLLKEDPFADLPPRKDGYSFRYWMDRAIEAGYPQAVVERSLSDWSRQTEGGTHAMKASSDSLNKLTTAAALGDPEIALTIGFRQSMYENPDRMTHASAWMLAACRLGADCSASSNVVPFWMCYDPNFSNCSADGNVELMVSSALTPGDYSDAYAQSQVIEEALRSRDRDAIRKLLEKIL